jgi:predicted amidohydrolase
MKLAVSQFLPKFADPSANSQRIAEQIVTTKADLIVFPECALTGYCFRSHDEAIQGAVAISDKSVQALIAACREAKCFAIVGLAEKVNEDLFNSAALIGPNGLVGEYRKVHLPYIGLDRYAQAGDSFPLFDLPFGRVGIQICFDIRFPEGARTLSLKGADLIAVPTNWPESAELASDIMCPARCIENHIFVAAANRVGEENSFTFVGRSKIISPSGTVLAAADHTDEAILVEEVKLERARIKHLVRREGEYEMDLWGARRPDLYGPIGQPS